MAASEIHAEGAKELAQKIVESGALPPANLRDDERLALAWALKDAAIAAWGRTPGNVTTAAQALSALRPCTDSETHSVAAREIGAVTEWVLGIAALTLGKMSKAITHLDAATQQFQRVRQPASAAHAQVPKIMALSMLGLHEQAKRCGEQTYLELLANGDPQAAGKVSANLGMMHFSRNEHAEALRWYQTGVENFSLANDAHGLLGCQFNVADVHAAAGDLTRAKAIYASTLARAGEGGHHVMKAMVTESLALINLAQGQFRDALFGLEEARGQYVLLKMPQQLAIAEKQLGDAYLYLRLLPEALAIFDKVLVRLGDLEMVVEQAWVHVQRARTLAAMRRPVDEIAASLLRADELFSAQNIATGTAIVMLARAELELSQQHCEDARLLAATASETLVAAKLVVDGARADLVHAHALLQCGHIDAAAALFAKTSTSARLMQMRAIDIGCLVGSGLVALARNDVPAAEMAFDAAIEASEAVRSALPGDDLRHAFLLDQMRPYEALLRIALAAFDDAKASDEDSATRVLMHLERFRARVLGERLGQSKPANDGAHSSRVHKEGNAPSEAPNDRALGAKVNVETELRAHLNWLYWRRQKMMDEDGDAQSLSEETQRIEHELLEAARRRRIGAAPEARQSAAPLGHGYLNPATLRAALGSNDALVEYGVIDDELFACIVTKARVSLHRRVAHWPTVLQAISTVRFQIETCRNGAAAMNAHLPLLTTRAQRALQRAHDLVWAPWSAHLAGCSRVLVVPHEQLGALPFAALYDGGAYLAQRLNLAIVASARVALFGLTHPPAPARRALVLGEVSRLTHAADEAAFVADLFDGAPVLTGSSADAASLRSFSADADVLHLACHAEFRSDNPMFSALHLADGPFTVHDAETLHLAPGVVVLSACETGLSEYSRGDEMIGLVRAFLVAGASRVVATLWPVDDAVTRHFMAAFYPALRAGAAPAAALRVAQLSVMQTHPHPFHWAPFTLYGGW